MVLELIVELANKANLYIDTEAPWTLRKTDPERMKTVLFVLMESIRTIAYFLYPFMSESGAKMLALLARSPQNATTKLKSGEALPAPVGIFPRFDDKQAA